MAKKDCSKGYGCGKSCISRNRACNSKLGDAAKSLVDNYKALVSKITGAISAGIQAVKDKINPPPKEFKGRATQKPPERNSQAESLNVLTDGLQGVQRIRGGSDDEFSTSDVDLERIRNSDPEGKLKTLASSAETRFGELLSGIEEVSNDAIELQTTAKATAKRLAKGDYSSKDERKKLKTLLQTQKEALGVVNEELIKRQTALRDEFTSGSILTDDGAKNNIKQKFGEDIAKPKNEKGLEGLAFLEKATNGLISDQVQKIGIAKGRDYALSTEGILQIEGNSEAIAAHEAMHVLEAQNPEVNQFSLNYLATRTSAGSDEEEFVSLANSTGLAYGEDENHYEYNDDPRVINPYITKNYDEDVIDVGTEEGSLDPINEIDELQRAVKTTEVTSMMVETLFNPNMLAKVVASDPEAFRAFVGMLGALQDKRHQQLAGNPSTTFSEYYHEPY